MKGKRSHSKRRMVLAAAILSGLVIWLLIPYRPFREEHYSTVVTDRNGELLGARISDDGQWRFPPGESVPEKFSEALIQFEDRAFRWHPGVNPFAVARALAQNISQGRTVSGGSTITMQVVRMSRGKERNLWQKFIEAILAVKLEAGYSKDEILGMYASHAPFGGNVVGVEAASWRYFGKPADELSWAESATLAVLPNSPAMIHPGRNRDRLLKKRDRLLERLLETGAVDSSDFLLALSEPLPDAPMALPQLAPHLTDRLNISRHGEKTVTGIDIGKQRQVSSIVEKWNSRFRETGINDIAAVVINLESGETEAYCGNAGYGSGREGCEVDAAMSPRSTGSILKPFLYYCLLSEGTILPRTLIADIPVNINGFSPQNFDMKFYGAVPADEALARSLNVPAVHMLRRFGVPKFMNFLKSAGMGTLTRSATDYGLSLILGGAEGNLAEITAMYADMARAYMGKEDKGVFNDRTSIYCTLDALKEVNRPDEIDWRMMPSVRKTAWKTGTSYGFRDGWAIGLTPGYAVGVWVGNAKGNGCPGLTGARTAGPVMFDIFNMLPDSGWFGEPEYGEYIEAEVCSESGHLCGPSCDSRDTLMLPPNALRSKPCPYHRMVTLTRDGKYRSTAGDAGAVTVRMFILPPAMEWYYRQHHPEYRSLPPFRPGYSGIDGYVPMEFIYPENGSTVLVPKQLDGKKKGVVFNLAHSNPGKTVYWHMDGNYLTSTRNFHQLTLLPGPGRHTVTVTDEDGKTLSVTITCEGGSGNSHQARN